MHIKGAAIHAAKTTLTALTNNPPEVLLSDRALYEAKMSYIPVYLTQMSLIKAHTNFHSLLLIK